MLKREATAFVCSGMNREALATHRSYFLNAVGTGMICFSGLEYWIKATEWRYAINLLPLIIFLRFQLFCCSFFHLAIYFECIIEMYLRPEDVTV